jgi:phage-related protein
VSIRPEFEGDWSRSVNARASSAGRSGAGAFSKAFGAGLKGIGALAGVAIGANLSSAAAGAAALAPALTTVGVAAGALKLGLSGVGEAFKQAFADSSADAAAAASATRAVESAQRGLENAQRSLARARVDAARRVADAQRQVADAERDLADAQQDGREVQGELNDARREAARALQDMNQRLAESHLDEREAVLRLKEAQEELKAAQRKKGVTPQELEELQIRYERAKLNLTEQRRETARLAADTKAANKAGVEGSEQVLAVRERISEAGENVADKERALADAQRGVDEARAEGARQIEDAQRAVAEAAAAVADAQAAAAAQTSKFGEAMAKLAPNAQSFVRAVQGLAPVWTDMKLAVQNELFKGLDDTVTSLGRTTIPILREGLTATAGIWNQIAKNAASGIEEMARTGLMEKILQGANDNLAVFKDTPKQLITAWGQLAVAAQPAFNQLLQQMAGGLKSFSEGIAASFESGGLEKAITSAFEILSQFGTLIGNVLGTVQEVFRAASDAGGEIVGSLAAVFGELERILAAPQMQAQMRSLFASVSQIVSAIVPIIGAVVQAVVPLLAAIAQPIAQLATALGPVLQQLASALGAALLPIVQALAPAVVLIGTAIVELVRAVMPLIEPIAALISGVIAALAPALEPIVRVAAQLITLLVGPLMAVMQALTPALIVIADMVTQVFQALEPMLQPLVDLLGQVAELVAGVLTIAIGQLMQVLPPLVEVGMQLVGAVFAALEPLLPVIGAALEAVGGALLTMLPALLAFADAAIVLVEGLTPLIPIGVQLVTTVLEALLPVLPAIADAFVEIAGALVGIVGPLAEMAGTMAETLGPILSDIAPILGDFVGLLAGTLTQVLPPLTGALLILVGAFSPLFPVLAELVGMILEMAAGVLVQLLPSILQLVQAGVSLALALLPIVPPLAELVGLVLELAVNVLSWLLPPLLSLADFLIGGLASALSTAIGWVAGLITVVADLVTWVLTHLGPAFRWLADKVVKPVWGFIAGTIKGAWTYGIKPIFQALNAGVDEVGDTFTWLRDHAVKPIWDGIKNTISGVWKYGIKPVFKTLQDAVKAIATSFDTARKNIKTAWDKLEGIAKAPIQFIVDVVYNNGIRGVWNKIAGAFGAPKLDKFVFARGGILPGYTPGRDPHRFYSPSGMALEMSGGEAIMRPEFTRAVGSGFVNSMNYIARSGGAEGVRRALAPLLGGDPDTPVDRSLRYARGGITQRFADGGIFGWIKSAGSAVVGAGSTAWNKIKEGASWLADTLEASARAGVEKVVDPLLKRFPGMDTGFGAMLRRIPTKIIDALFGYSKEADKRGAGGIGGPRIQAALKWAKTQHGLRYQWGGNGNPSWDCSGFMSAIESVIRGQKPHRRWSTHAFQGGNTPPGWVRNGASAFRVGITHDGVGHTAGTLGRTNVESRGGDGVVVGRRARGYNDKLFTSWYGFQPGKYDSGGWLQSGGVGVNLLSKPEAVLTPSQWTTMTTIADRASDPVVVEVHTRDRALAEFIDVRVHRNNQELAAVINAN